MTDHETITSSSTTGRRVALVANASFYIGPPLARELARRGHDLVIGDPEPGLVDELESLGATVATAEGVWDLADAEVAERLVQTGLDRFGASTRPPPSPARSSPAASSRRPRPTSTSSNAA